MKWYQKEASSGLVALVLMLFIACVLVWSYVISTSVRSHRTSGEPAIIINTTSKQWSV